MCVYLFINNKTHEVNRELHFSLKSTHGNRATGEAHPTYHTRVIFQYRTDLHSTARGNVANTDQLFVFQLQSKAIKLDIFTFRSRSVKEKNTQKRLV